MMWTGLQISYHVANNDNDGMTLKRVCLLYVVAIAYL